MSGVAAPGADLRRVDDKPLDLRPGEILLVSVVRDEEARLPYLIAYYRELGVSRFLFIDNASTDRTESLLLSLPDVHVFHAADSYSSGRWGLAWLNSLLHRWGSGHWVVVADADELLVYPDSESTSLPLLVRRLEEEGATGMLTFLLDMYAAGPVREAEYVPGTPFLDTCPYFDADSYTLGTTGLRGRIPARGGARRRLFWRPGTKHHGNPPYLPKIPLVKWQEGLAFSASTHEIADVRLSRETGVLLHFKLFADFVRRAESEARRGEHWDRAAQYAVYAEALRETPDLDPMYAGSVRYRDSRQLIEMGLMIDASHSPQIAEGA